MSPKEIRETLGVSKQGAVDIENPLLQAGLVERVGSHKAGKYVLK
jgi:DNA-binding MarR family transcriptional regulator